MSESQILQILSSINQRLSSLEENVPGMFSSINQRLSEFDHRLSRIEENVADIGGRLKKVESRVKDINGEVNRLFKMVNNLNEIVGSESYDSVDSIYLEKDVNQSVIEYYKKSSITYEVFDIKSATIDQLNRYIDKKLTKLFLYPANEEKLANHISELDGLAVVYQINLKDEVHKQLVIIEAKLEFDFAHLQRKLNILKRIKQLITTPKNRFANLDYGRFIEDTFGDYHTIVAFYGTSEWKVDLDNLYVLNNKLYYKHELALETSLSDTINPSLNLVTELYDDDIPYPIFDRPDLKFLLPKGKHFKVHGSFDSISGGESINSGVSEYHSES